MKKQLLLTLLMLFVGLNMVKADNININVDNAANVLVTVDNGQTVVDLIDGMNRITEYSAENNPLMISAANGAKIVSVTKNNTDVLSPNYVGDYAMGIEPMLLDIVTEGGAGDEDKSVNVWFQLQGAVGSVTIVCDNENIPVSSETFSYSLVKAGAECIISPTEGYVITEVTGERCSIVENGDGTWSYSTTIDYSFANIFTEAVAVDGTPFTVQTAYLPNLSVKAGRVGENDEEWKDIAVADDGSAIFPDGWQYVVFEGADDAEVISVKRNGNELTFSPYAGWRSVVEANDVFSVVTRGPEMDVTFYSNDFYNGVGLEIFNVTAGGEPIALMGEQETVKLHRGDEMNVSGKGSNICNWVMCGNSFYEQAPFTFNLENNNLITISGTSVSGLVINVDDASAVVVRQLNGYGDILSLTDGQNMFDMAAIKNNLSITAAENCQITDVTVNQTLVQPTSSGAYSIVAEDGMQIDIHARHTPASIPVTVMVCDIENGDAVSDMLASHVNMTVAGEKVELQGLITLNVPYMAEVTVSGEYGYVLESVNAGNNFVQVADGEYTFFAGEPCTLTLSMREIVAPEGYALVKFIKNNKRIGFYPYNADLEREDGAYSVDQPGVVKIGNYVCVSKFAYDFFFESITVNGKPIEIVNNQESYQEYFIKIEEDCTIEARLYDPNDGTCPITCWNMNDDIFGITVADMYINDNGTLTKHYNALPGETVEFVVPYVAPGFELKYISGKNFNSPDLEANSFTFTVPDELRNPTSGDVYTYVFEPLCEINPADPPYVLEFFKAYENREIIGYVVGIEPYFNREVSLMFATEGMEVTVLAYERDDYELVRLYTNTDRTITSPYTVSADDAYDVEGYNKVNIGGEYKLRNLSSVEEVIATEGVRYNAAVQTVTGMGSIKVMNLNGIVVASGENTVNVETLPAGIYVASDGNTTVKFVKK